MVFVINFSVICTRIRIRRLGTPSVREHEGVAYTRQEGARRQRCFPRPTRKFCPSKLFIYLNKLKVLSLNMSNSYQTFIAMKCHFESIC